MGGLIGMKFGKFIIVNLLLILLLNISCAKSFSATVIQPFSATVIQPFSDFTYYNAILNDVNVWAATANPVTLESSSLNPEAVTYLNFNVGNTANFNAQLILNSLVNIVNPTTATAYINTYLASNSPPNPSASLPIPVIGSALSSIPITTSFSPNTLTWNLGTIPAQDINHGILSLAIIPDSNSSSQSIFIGENSLISTFNPELKVESSTPAPAPSSLLYSLAGLIGMLVIQINNKKLLLRTFRSGTSVFSKLNFIG